MFPRMKRSSCVLGLALVLGFAGTAVAQVSMYEVRSGEVLAVDGNRLFVRGPQGIKEIEVSDDFRFDIDGRQLSVHDLKPGMKLTAMIKTTTTPVELVETKYREAEVVHVMGSTVVLKNLETGEHKQFTAKDAEGKDLLIVRDGSVVQMSDLRKGDKIAATIVSRSAPVLVTQTDVAVYGTQPPPPPRPKSAPASTPPPPAATTIPSPPPAPQLPKTAGPVPLIGLLGGAVLGLGLAMRALRRRRSD